jgi:hypothetical protein
MLKKLRSTLYLRLMYVFMQKSRSVSQQCIIKIDYDRNIFVSIKFGRKIKYTMHVGTAKNVFRKNLLNSEILHLFVYIRILCSLSIL